MKCPLSHTLPPETSFDLPQESQILFGMSQTPRMTINECFRRSFRLGTGIVRDSQILVPTPLTRLSVRYRLKQRTLLIVQLHRTLRLSPLMPPHDQKGVRALGHLKKARCIACQHQCLNLWGVFLWHDLHPCFGLEITSLIIIRPV